MKRHPEFSTFVMEKMTGLSAEVMAAREHMAMTHQSYSRAAKKIGVSKDMIKSVLIGRKTSARVLAGIMALPRMYGSLEEFEAANSAKSIGQSAEGKATRERKTEDGRRRTAKRKGGGR